MKLPTTATLAIVCCCCPVFGVTEVITGVPESTVKPLVNCAFSPPVVTTGVRAPVAALAEIVMTAVALVVLLTVSEFTVMPAPKLATELLCEKLVLCPTMTMLALLAP